MPAEPPSEPADTSVGLDQTSPDQTSPELAGPQLAGSEPAGSEPADGEDLAEHDSAEQDQTERPDRALPEPAERPDPAREAARRRRLAEVFGDVLPEATADDRPEPGSAAGADERWYTENRPPHHGG